MMKKQRFTVHGSWFMVRGYWLAVIGCWMTVLGLAAPKQKPQLYVPMDYSTCGYRASEVKIPEVKGAVMVAWQEGDCSRLIQQAIDKVAAMKPDAQGRRGAVVLGEGRFLIDTPLRISASGIVLRGQGRDATTLVKRGVDRGALLYIEGSTAHAEKPYFNVDKQRNIHQTDMRLIPIADETVKAGNCQLSIVNCQLSVGDRIAIVRPSTWEWICGLKMDDFGGGLDYTGWKPTDIDITWDRVVTAVDGNRITLDAPITTTIMKEQGGGYIYRPNHTGELKECGVEWLSMESEVNDWNPKDEDHCWDGVYINNVRDAWVRGITFRHFAGSVVNLQRNTSRITVEDCIAQEPVSEVGGWRRCVFLTRGQQTLFQRCISRQGIHDFAAGYCAAGPNAFVQCEGEESMGFSGSIGSWAAGLLFDIVNIDGGDLRFANLEQFQFGTGWNTANSMFWQCTASTLECYSPDSLNRSSGHGCWGTLTGNGNWTSSNDHVSPRSLFYDQLMKRCPDSDVDPRILPRPTNASTSPTVEEAMEMAQLSLKEPRLTMEQWIVESEKGKVKSEKFATATPYRTVAALLPPSPTFDFHSSIKADGRLLTGNLYAIPWWSGRVKDNFVQTDARPAITRFVPGREGTGWTDRIDSVVARLSGQHFAALDHHYGLWYDLRRTDHERVRRADGDVWAPFYEQPFSRSGQGTAWDGLSRYDLTKPNRWYWARLNSFAQQAARQDMLLYCEHYFQHNILEAGAHWVDCPWRPVNNVNYEEGGGRKEEGGGRKEEGLPFPEPVPFAGDKRIYMAEQFYNEQDPVLRPLHKQYIRMCLDQMKDQPNVVHFISAEFTGPFHFTRFWLETIADWERETGHDATVALSCPRDVQDSVLSDPSLRAVVDMIDIRYWHYNTEGLWAPQGGRNMALRQWMRKMKVGKTGFDEAYRAVREMRDRYPEKAVVFSAQQYPDYGWAVLMAGGSLPNIPIRTDTADPLQQQLLSDLSQMQPMDGEGCVSLLLPPSSFLVYTQSEGASISVPNGKYDVYLVDMRSGAISRKQKNLSIADGRYSANLGKGRLVWLRKR